MWQRFRARLNRASVPPAAYRLSTIDGWAIRLVATFPRRSEIDPEVLNLANPGAQYPVIREAAARLLRVGHINDLLAATYAGLLVDEYQDCSRRQHAMVYYAAHVLPTCALGDPMQAIFGFSAADPLAEWDKDVCSFFPKAGELDRPWRWINVGSHALGEWLLEVRRTLVTANPIELRTAPDGVRWIELDGSTGDEAKLANAARWTGRAMGEDVLVIGDSRNKVSRHQLASVVPGAVVVEPVDLGDMVSFLRDFDPTAADALDRLLTFAEDLMTGVGRSDVVRRVGSLMAGRGRKAPTDVERAALDFLSQRTPTAVAVLLSAISSEKDVRIFRPAILRGCIRALELSADGEGLSPYDAAVRIREQSRWFGRAIPNRAVGSTLLLKGLEAKHVVILRADALDAANLYVAITRGSKSVTVCSRSPILNCVR